MTEEITQQYCPVCERTTEHRYYDGQGGCNEHE